MRSARRRLIARPGDDGDGEAERGARDRFDGQFDAVLEGVRLGEPWAFDRVFQALAPLVTGYLRAQGAAEPDDLTSDVFLGVLRNIDGFEGDEPGFRSWVFTIAHRRLTDERRRAGRRPTLEPLTVTGDTVASDDVEEAVGQTLATDRVRALCERLVPDQRDVLLMRLVAQMSVDDVAVALGKTPGAVKALQRRGFRAVGRMLEREGARP